MRYLFILLLITSTAYGQTLVPFATGRATDTAYAARSLRVDSVVRLVRYGSTDTNKVIGVDAGGRLVLRTKTTGGGSVDSTVYATIARLYKVADSVANEIPVDYVDSARLADTAAAIRSAIPSVAGYATTAALADSVSGRQKYGDTVSWDATRYWVHNNYVPYIGATRDVDVRNFGLLANHVNTDTLEPNGSAGLHVHNTSHQDIFIAGAGGGQNLTVYAPTTYTLMANGSETDTVLGTNSSGLLKKIGIGTTYLKKADTVSLSNRIDAKMGYADTTSLSNRINLKLNASDTSSNVVTNMSFRTLSNKRWVPRVISSASYTTSVTIPADSVDLFQITAQAGALLFNAPSGTPNNGDLLVIRIKDNGTARALTYNAIFNWSPPSTTVLGKYLVMCFMYNSVTSNWNFMWKRDEP
jgi:hypothetical protein